MPGLEISSGHIVFTILGNVTSFSLLELREPKPDVEAQLQIGKIYLKDKVYGPDVECSEPVPNLKLIDPSSAGHQGTMSATRGRATRGTEEPPSIGFSASAG